MPNPLGYFMRSGEPPKVSPLQVLLDRAFSDMTRLPNFVPGLLSASPELAAAIVEEMERLCIGAAATFHEALVALRTDPVKAFTPVAQPERREGA